MLSETSKYPEQIEIVTTFKNRLLHNFSSELSLCQVRKQVLVSHIFLPGTSI